MKFTLITLVTGLLATQGNSQIDQTPACKLLLDAGHERSTVECVANSERPMDCFPPQLILASDAQLTFLCNANKKQRYEAQANNHLIIGIMRDRQGNILQPTEFQRVDGPIGGCRF